MALCSACNRSFKSETSLNQHKKYSPVHAAMVPCDRCSIWLPNTDALEEHIQTSPAHNTPECDMSSKFKCDICDTIFVSQIFLHEHLQYSPLNATSLAHKFYSITFLARKVLEESLQSLQNYAPTFECDPCDRSFVSQDALDSYYQFASEHTSTFEYDPRNRSFSSPDALDSHIQFASAYTPAFECGPCNRSFISQDALDSHIQTSSAHTDPFRCNPCSRPFKSQAALDSHLQNSKAHTGEPGNARTQEHRSKPTPIDKFFAKYPLFKYDHNLSPSVSYAKFVKFYGWDKNGPKARKARREYQDALEDEVRLWFGSTSDLASWHALCRAVGIEPLPESCKAGRKAIRGVYVNIIDLIQWARKGLGDRPIRRFKNLDDLSDYTKLTGKFYSNRGHTREERNVVLRHLLRHILSSGSLLLD
ncbi:transcriptional regulator family: C2H2 zinc finger [Penicillium tannophilum]|nr:transcriptional regulator family: C2H2 zinc finger [Penicillium tannophilum]